jgi:hypothetical protein
MRKLHRSILLALLISCAAFSTYPQVPGNLPGKWNLRADHSKLIGTIKITSDGQYVFVVAPNYRESGVLNLRTAGDHVEIDLIKRSNSANTITRGIYRIGNNTMELCLGGVNEVRPARFGTDHGQQATLWFGRK